MFDKVLSTPPVLNMPGFWIAQDFEYVPGLEFVRVLDLPDFWIYQRYSEFRICLNMPYYVWMCLNMLEYVQICLNGFCFTFFVFTICFTIPFLLEHVVTYLNFHRRLEVIVWRNVWLFSWRDKILFFL